MSHDRTASPASSAPVKLEVHDIHKRYGAHEVLKGVSLTAHAGDVISIIGSSGSGKSTLLRCINLLERPQQGRIVVAAEQLQLRLGRDGALEASDPRQLQRLRTRLAMVFQHFNLWAHMTVLHNIIEVPVQVLGLAREEAIERARKYLRLVGLEDDEAGIGLRALGRNQKVNRARRRRARLEAQETAQAVVDRVDVVELLGDRIAGDFRHAADRHLADFTFAMNVQQLDRALPSHVDMLRSLRLSPS